MKQGFYFILFVCILLSCNPHPQKGSPAKNEREVTDMSGRKVIIPKEIKKIIAFKIRGFALDHLS